MPAYVTGETDDVEEEQSEQEPIDDRHSHLNEEISLKYGCLDSQNGFFDGTASDFGQRPG